MKQLQKGFTLIELMIVVAIIGILAAVAIPAYQDYVIKAKLSKVQTVLDSIKSGFAMYYQENSGFPQAGGAHDTVLYPGGAVTFTYPTPVLVDDVWTSLGFKTVPTLSKEMAQIVYVSAPLGAGTQAPGFSLQIQLANIKATPPAIDGTFVTIYPRGMNETALQWEYSCTSNEPLVLKYFKRPSGADCATAALNLF